jgi:hypothetical protein
MAANGLDALLASRLVIRGMATLAMQRSACKAAVEHSEAPGRGHYHATEARSPPAQTSDIVFCLLYFDRWNMPKMGMFRWHD